jgi:hypothetical protein
MDRSFHPHLFETTRTAAYPVAGKALQPIRENSEAFFILTWLDASNDLSWKQRKYGASEYPLSAVKFVAERIGVT